MGVSQTASRLPKRAVERVFVELAIQSARLREQNSLSQREFARRLHTSQQTISKLESPHNESLSLHSLMKLAHAIGKELKVFFIA